MRKVSIHTIEVAIGLARSVANGATKFPFLGYCADLMERMKNELEETRKTMPYKNKEDRNYKREYETYQGKPEQIKNRAMRNKARATLAKDGKVAKGDGMDVSHKKALDKGGSNKDGLKVQTDNANRSFKRDAKKNLVSEVSKRERKKA
jgi:phosphoglucomutase